MEAKLDCISDKSTNTNSNMCVRWYKLCGYLLKTEAELPSHVVQTPFQSGQSPPQLSKLLIVSTELSSDFFLEILDLIQCLNHRMVGD